jgi:hypothetical protein
MHIPMIIFACLSSRFEDAHVEDHTTGRSVLSLIPARKLAVVTQGNFTIPALRVLIFVKEVARKVIRVSSRMEFLSAGFILHVTVLSRVKTVQVAAGEFVFLLTRRSNFVLRLNTVHGVLTLLIHTTVVLSVLRLSHPV